MSVISNIYNNVSHVTMNLKLKLNLKVNKSDIKMYQTVKFIQLSNKISKNKPTISAEM